ncbi:YhcN/YlaJ family sporulation lipoprotein [Bacillus timonensis]|nr:YhcN/YlaJ family sporulation lipoprotein [Bacillus timonensis]
MRNKAVTFSAVLILSGLSLVGCNTDQGALDTRYNDNARPIGYYSNENVDHNDKNGNAYIMDDNDGPLTEIMDRNIGQDNNGTNYGRNYRGTSDGQRYRALGNGVKDTEVNPTVPYGNRDKNFFIKDNRFSRGDANYHGHIDNNNFGRARSSAYYRNFNGELAEQITAKVANINNVDDVRAVIMGDSVVIAIDTNDKNDTDVTERVEDAVRPLVRGKDINVVTDEGTFSRVRNLDNEMRNGGTRETIDADFDDLFENIGNAFRNNQ